MIVTSHKKANRISLCTCVLLMGGGLSEWLHLLEERDYLRSQDLSCSESLGVEHDLGNQLAIRLSHGKTGGGERRNDSLGRE